MTKRIKYETLYWTSNNHPTIEDVFVIRQALNRMRTSGLADSRESNTFKSTFFC